MAERGRRLQIEPIWNRGADHVAEVAIIDREILRQRIVKRQVGLIVEAQRIVVGRTFGRISLLGLVVDTGEAIIGTREQSPVRARKIRLAMAAGPSVVKIW